MEIKGVKKKKLQHILPILIFAFLSVFVISKILFSGLLIGRSLDSTIPPVSNLVSNVLNSNFYTWSSVLNSGVKNVFAPTLIPINIILYMPSLLFNVGPAFIARYQLVIALIFCQVFAYLFSLKLLSKYAISYKQKVFVSFVSSILFTLNNYIFCEFIFGSSVMYLTFIFIPFLLYSYILYLEENRKIFFVLAYISIVITSSTIQHLLFSYILIFLISSIYKEWKKPLLIIIPHLILSLYWILPVLSTVSEVASNELVADYSSGLVNSSSSFFTALVNSDYFGNRDMYRLALKSTTLSSMWTINGVLIFLISLIPFFNFRRFPKTYKNYILVFTSALLGSLLFIKGAKDPFGSIILDLYSKIPILNIFRSVQRYIGFYLLAQLVLFSLSSAFLVKRYRRISLILLFIVTINALPWWYTRDLGTVNISSVTDYPTFGMYELTEGNKKFYKLHEDPLDYNIMVIPPAHSINFIAIGSAINDTQGGDPGLSFGNKGFFTTDMAAGPLNEILIEYEREMYVNPKFVDNFKCLLPLLNVKYMVLREDVSPNFSEHQSLFNPMLTKGALYNSDMFSDINTVDYITIAKIRADDFVPHIYIPSEVHIVEADIKDLMFICQSFSNLNEAIIFKNQNLNYKEVNNINSGNIEYKKINPTKYLVKATGVGENFHLVFSEGYNSRWKIFPAGEIKYSKGKYVSPRHFGTIQNDNLGIAFRFSHLLNKQIVSDNSHIIINGYANGWVVNSKEMCDLNTSCKQNNDGTYDFDFTLEYIPQRYMYAGAIIGLLFLLSVGMMFLIL